MSERCERFEREQLADLLDESGAAAGGAEAAERAAHVERCADCRGHRARYEQIARALADLGTEVQRRPDHVARVLAASQPATSTRPRRARRAAWLLGPLLTAALAVAALWWLRRPAPPRPQFAVEIVARPVVGLEAPTPGALRGDAHLGDALRITADPGTAIWIYRNDRELLRVCPRDCRRDGDRLVAEVDLDTLGRYQVVWLSTERVPAPVGEIEHDVAAAHAAGATHELRDLEVQ